MSLHARKMYSSRDVATEPSAEPAAGYMIDERGREIPITEAMIQKACAALHEHWIPSTAEARSGAAR